MNKVKLFISNFIVYGLGSVIAKVIPFIMLPILTRLYPSAEYMGLNDLVLSIASIGSAVAVLGMNNAMFRLFFEEDTIDYRKKVCSSTLGFVVISSSIVAILFIIFRKDIALLFFSDKQYLILVWVAIFCMVNDSIKNISSTPTRMENKRRIFLIVNVVSPTIAYSIAIILIKNGLYVMGLPLAMLISALIENVVFIIINRKWFDVKNIRVDIIKKMCALALPLAPNFIIYWVFNSSDKLMITNMLGTYEFGIYSVGAKMGHMSQLIYTAFASGWQYFAFYTMKDKNQVKNNSLIFEYLGVITFSVTIFVCLFSKLIFRILFPEEYMVGRYVMPYLFLAPLLLMLFQVISNQFLVIKKTWPNAIILSFGAILNLVLNAILIPRIGIEGAAIATLLGYVSSIMICVVVLRWMKLLDVPGRVVAVWALFAMFFVVWRFINEQYLYVCVFIAFFIMAVYLLMYKKEWILLVGAISKKENVSGESINNNTNI